ncbi:MULTISPECIES: hypothetical protein [unclassified Pseudonocardia]|nr:hypothetical protein [Pseudonocardia sp. Ae707_Ps1]OLM19980.1 hypothetical protein Ae707Ps1_4239c [Pseudonocardia sp. Ae707_Ps1]
MTGAASWRAGLPGVRSGIGLGPYQNDRDGSAFSEELLWVR